MTEGGAQENNKHLVKAGKTQVILTTSEKKLFWKENSVGKHRELPTKEAAFLMFVIAQLYLRLNVATTLLKQKRIYHSPFRRLILG